MKHPGYTMAIVLIFGLILLGCAPSAKRPLRQKPSASVLQTQVIAFKVADLDAAARTKIAEAMRQVTPEAEVQVDAENGIVRVRLKSRQKLPAERVKAAIRQAGYRPLTQLQTPLEISQLERRTPIKR